MKVKYKVTAYALRGTWAYKADNSVVWVYRWCRVNTWYTETRAQALKIMRTWSDYLQPFFKATMQSVRKKAK